MKTKYIQPACRAFCLDTSDTLLVTSIVGGISVYPDKTLDASEALVQENVFDFSWE